MTDQIKRTLSFVDPKKTKVVVNKKGFNGLERIILTSDGNLQRTMSAYFNMVIELELVHFTKVSYKENEFDREILLKCQNKVFCNAKSHLEVKSDEILSLLVDKGMGIGQVFASLKRIPQFSLLSCGKDDARLWRTYTLTTDGLLCTITEIFPVNMFSDDFFSDQVKFTEKDWNTPLPSE
eukprot:TRINITY_DN886_c0_g1_i4.p1 TRINITY_DN886_c0_g1~~TRINITY_DN886_c0_g1_i4.p1  ORF type:complete len:180 (-),score=11.20 TRINITY_DN886_c0_g1_i4:91-630(-)